MKKYSFMKNIRCLMCFLLFIPFYLGCNKSESIEYFTRKDFKQVTKLNSEIIEILTSKPIDPRKLTVVRDSILLIQNRNTKDFYIDIYNIKSKKGIVSIVPKGKGPNESLRGDEVLYNHNDNYFWVRDKTMWRMSRYNIDSVLQMGIDYRPKHYRGSSCAKGISEYDENHFICFNNRFINKEEYSNKNIQMLYKKRKIDYSQKDNEMFEWVNYPANVTGGYIYCSKAKDSILVSHLFIDRIDICNKNLEVIKSLVGPDNLEPRYIRAHGKWELILHADNRCWSSYRSGFYTKDAIYLLYDGVNGVDYEDYKLKSSEIFKIGWSGELLHRYILDVFVSEITIDSENKYIYGCSHESPKGGLKLVRFSLN